MPTNDYFEQLEERVMLRIATERIAPSLANHDKTFATTDLPTNYFEGLEAAVFARIAAEAEAENKKNAAFAKQKPTFTVTKTNKKMWWSAAIGTAVAAVLVGVLVLKPNTEPEIAAISAPLSTETEQLFAQLNTTEALNYLQNDIINLDETILETKLANTPQDDFANLQSEDIADFVNENDIEL